MSAVKSSGVSKQTKDQVAAIIRKLQGRRATTKMTDEEKQAALAAGKEIVEVSSSQMSIDNRFGKLRQTHQIACIHPRIRTQ